MRIWSLHPRFLDSKGLVALWRETLLARKVLTGGTKGYVNHPQLDRFKALVNPVGAIDRYLKSIFDEAVKRGFKFDISKIGEVGQETVAVTTGQIEYEWKHLLSKLKTRDPKKFKEIFNKKPDVHEMFLVIKGGVQAWEKIKE